MACERRPLRLTAVARLALAVALFARPAGAFEGAGAAPRLAAGGWVDGLAVAGTGSGARQRPEALLALRLEGTVTPALTAHAELRTRVGGPFEGGHPGIYSLVHTFQNRSPACEASEAYGELRLARADVRAGIQRFAWGKLDGIPPTDVLNPRDFHDPVVRDAEERKIGIPAVAATYYPGAWERLDVRGLRASLVYVPIAVPSRLPLLAERWFPPTAKSVPPVVIPAAALGLPSFPRALLVPVTFRTRNHRPPLRLEAGGVGLRLSGTCRESDWDLYHYTGPETGPNLDLRPILTLAVFDPAALERTRLGVEAELRQAHDVMHMTGADASTALGPMTLRAEAAHLVGRPYLRPASSLVAPENLRRLPVRQIGRTLVRRGRAVLDLGDLFLARDALEWGLGADWLVHGVLPLVQVNQIVLLEPAPELLIGDPETRLTASVRRRFRDDRLELEVRGTYGIEREHWLVLPRASYSIRDDLRVSVGYLALGGPPDSLLGQFRANDEVVLQARYTF